MFDSPALETAIGLAALLFILATVASSVLELGRRLINSRATDLERALQSLLLDPPKLSRTQAMGRRVEHVFRTVGAPALDAEAQTVWDTFVRSSIYQGATAARGQVRPAYLSAKTLAEAVEETIAELPEGKALTGSLKQRVKFLHTRVGADLMQFRAGLERWFDESMEGLSSRYRKRSALILFLLGFVLAVGTNASVPHIAQDLWKDPVTRQTVVAAAEKFGAEPEASTAPAGTGSSGSGARVTGDEVPGEAPAGGTLSQVADATDQLATLDLPIGWDPLHRPTSGMSWFVHVLGWLLTAALVGMGAPFWFDLLGRLVSVRSPRPALAVDDSTSATAVVSSATEPAGSGAVTPVSAPPDFWKKVARVSS